MQDFTPDQPHSDLGAKPAQREAKRTALERCRSVMSDALHETREAWPALSSYERFEQVVSLFLTALIGAVIVAALVHLTIRILLLLVFGLVDPANQAVFQAVFGMIMTVLIALEFNHSLLTVLHRKESVIQVKTVVLIALLAIVRKFIIIDVKEVEAMTLIGLGLAVLALGGVYWLIRDQDRREAAQSHPVAGDAS